MSKISKDTENAIRDAIILEINGRKFFNHAAEVTHHPKGKKMFQHLADEEVKHLETFSKMFNEILGGSDWKKDLIPDDVSGEAPLVEKLKESMKQEDRKGEVEALRIGMELERNAITFFQEAAAATDDPVAKKIFLEISEEEKFHFDLLQAQYDSVTGSGFWLGSAEFQMDGKW
ncbi:MAG: ferritin family protein [Candidatus Aminicenantes bacterium]|nr:MAG: ferritin family protein [Candidatus Aminicenantes bacterium]